MLKKALLVVLGVLLAALLIGFVVGQADATAPNPNHKVDVCHRTGSATNPYVFINVDIASSGYVKGGHDAHEQVGNGLGGDIIAAYTYTSKKDGSVFNYPGKNLDTVIGGAFGRDILANGCVIPPVETTPPPTTVPPTTPPPTTVPPTTPPTTVPPTTPPTKVTCHDTKTCFTPTWAPTWTPPGGGPGEHRLASTGFNGGVAAAAAGILGTTGLGALWLTRKRVRG